MHPVVGAGVRDFSDFKTDPWGRLDRTLLSLQVQLFGGTRALEEAERLRQVHRAIRGVGFDGQPYSALNQSAYAWVHMSNFDTLMEFDRLVSRRLTVATRAQMYQEWRQTGLILGIRDDHMPADLRAFRNYVDETVANTLTDNPTARDVLASLRMRDVGPPPWPMFPETLWRAVRPLGRSVLHDATVGSLPPGAREKLHLTWMPSDQRRLRAFAIAVRTASTAVPERLMQYPLARQAQIEAKRYRAHQRTLQTAS
jgi:uncharacterized protein (DUF2236 family)